MPPRPAPPRPKPKPKPLPGGWKRQKPVSPHVYLCPHCMGRFPKPGLCADCKREDDKRRNAKRAEHGRTTAAWRRFKTPTSLPPANAAEPAPPDLPLPTGRSAQLQPGRLLNSLPPLSRQRRRTTRTRSRFLIALSFLPAQASREKHDMEGKATAGNASLGCGCCDFSSFPPKTVSRGDWQGVVKSGRPRWRPSCSAP
jgi:hypothetical protein